MKLADIYELAIKLGMQNDLRGEEAAKKDLSKARTEYNALSVEKKILIKLP